MSGCGLRHRVGVENRRRHFLTYPLNIDMSQGAELRSKIKQVMVDELMLDFAPEEIDNETPIFGAEGLGLDSVDALQLVVAIEKHFGFKIGDAEKAKNVLKSVETIARAIEAA